MSNNRASSAAGQVRNASFRSSNMRFTKESGGGGRLSLSAVWARHVSVAPVVLALVAAILSAANLPAQTSGTVSGHVSDTTGAAIPHAAIKLTNIATGAGRSTLTTDAGDYTFTAVPPAVYAIQVTHNGFKAAASSSIQLDVQQSLRQDFTMEVGASD